jgi:ABC-type transport system involved in multi-copper enzyme maturation permease subunit
MELLLSQPLARWQYLSTQVAFAFLALASLTIFGMIGTLFGQRYFALGFFELRPFLQVALNFFLLQSAWYGLTLLFSVFGRESGHVVGAAFFLALASYIVQVLGKIWPALSGLLPFSLYNYYSSQEILVQSTFSENSAAILASVFLIGIGFTAWRFQKRDIP